MVRRIRDQWLKIENWATPLNQRARFDEALSDDRQYLGEKYLPVFLSDISNILK